MCSIIQTWLRLLVSVTDMIGLRLVQADPFNSSCIASTRPEATFVSWQQFPGLSSICYTCYPNIISSRYIFRLMTSKGKEVPDKRLKIVCLHGYGTNKEFMKMQTNLFCKDFILNVDFIFVDGPVVVSQDLVNDPKVIKNLEAPPRSWFDWQSTNKTESRERAVEHFKKIVQVIADAGDHFDGAMGFSQGSMAFQSLLLFRQMGLISHPILDGIKFFMNFSADNARVSLRMNDWKRFSIPSIHFMSQEDFLFNRCVITPVLYSTSQVIFHSFGHRFPLLGMKEKKQLTNFLLRYGYEDSTTPGIEKYSRL